MKLKSKQNGKHEMLNFSGEQLLNMPESTLLNIVILYFELQHPEMKADNAIANELGVTAQAIGNYRRGNGHIGYEGWRKLYELTRCELILDWKRAKWTF